MGLRALRSFRKATPVDEPDQLVAYGAHRELAPLARVEATLRVALAARDRLVAEKRLVAIDRAEPEKRFRSLAVAVGVARGRHRVLEQLATAFERRDGSADIATVGPIRRA
jgi:hypothetical protein